MKFVRSWSETNNSSEPGKAAGQHLRELCQPPHGSCRKDPLKGFGGFPFQLIGSRELRNIFFMTVYYVIMDVFLEIRQKSNTTW